MSDRYLYVYFMRDRPDRIGQVVPEHIHYWQDLELPGYMGGPFADHSGGSISFKAGDRLEAEQRVASDPFVEADLVSESWLKVWQVE
jgi:uncharacterized protein YciI